MSDINITFNNYETSCASIADNQIELCTVPDDIWYILMEHVLPDIILDYIVLCNSSAITIRRIVNRDIM